MAIYYGAVAGVVAAIYVSFQLLLHFTQDKREPPSLATTIPFLSPIIGMSRKKTKYYIELRDKYRLPIYTLRLPGSRLYVVNSPSLISAVQKQHKALAFMPMAAKGSIKVSRFSTAAADIINTNTNGEEGDWGYVHTFHDAIQSSLSPGTKLDAMNRVMLGLVAASIDHIAKEPAMCVLLHDWVKHQITLASTDSVYGPANPFRDSAIKKAFWAFKDGMTLLVLGAFPTWTAKEAIQSLDIGSSAFEAYFRDGSHLRGSALVRDRYDHSTKHQVPLNDIARSEFVNGVALLANTVPTTFWMLFHIYSDSKVLAHCRAELASVVIVSAGKKGCHINTIDMSKIKTSCPVFLSTFKEVLRLHSTSVSARLVMKDHMLNNQYLLKKGSTVMMPGPVQHTFENIWGPDVDIFDYQRFTRPGKHHHTAAFRAFGGGTTLCSGRHFATTEILAFAAVMILRFDMIPKTGKWKQPSESKVEFWEATAGPDEDLEVEICLTSGEGSGDEWVFTLSDSDQPIELSAEDLHTERY